VDGFNLYYNALKDTPYKWLDLTKLSRLLLPQHDVHSIRYFTARVTAMAHDVDQPRRRETYLRALRTLPNLTIHFGSFKVYVLSRRATYWKSFGICRDSQSTTRRNAPGACLSRSMATSMGTSY
jgi:hypothetical protein